MLAGGGERDLGGGGLNVMCLGGGGLNAMFLGGGGGGLNEAYAGEWLAEAIFGGPEKANSFGTVGTGGSAPADMGGEEKSGLLAWREGGREVVWRSGGSNEVGLGGCVAEAVAGR
jgi:hypothetical protein